ncbi:hypothetical protein LN615_13545, partial [Proteus terrae]
PFSTRAEKYLFGGCLADINLSVFLQPILLIFIGIYSGTHSTTVLQTSTFHGSFGKYLFGRSLADVNL